MGHALCCRLHNSEKLVFRVLGIYPKKQRTPTQTVTDANLCLLLPDVPTIVVCNSFRSVPIGRKVVES